MRKTMAGVALAASLGVGALAGSALLGSAGAQTDEPSTTQDSSTADAAASDEAGTGRLGHRGPGVLSEVLDELVSAGTITADQQQAILDAVRAKAEELGGRPGGHGPDGGGHGGRHGHRLLEEAAEVIGVDVEVVLDGLRNGESIADIAAANGSSGQAVIDAAVDAAEERLAAKVAEGDLTQDEADDRLAELTERITAMVNGDLELGERPGRHGVEEDAAA